jgi:hypothetical protein
MKIEISVPEVIYMIKEIQTKPCIFDISQNFFEKK